MLYCISYLFLSFDLVTNITSGTKDGNSGGKIGKFQLSVEDWKQYAKRLEFFFTANGIMTAKKKATLLAVVGPTTYKLLRSMLALTMLGEVAFDNMVKVNLGHKYHS